MNLAVPSRLTYSSLFLIALATLAHQILLTRIFSVTMWYHFAFVAVSIAMFGLTAGAVIVFLLPRLFPPEGVARQLAVVAATYPPLIVVTFLTQLSVPFVAHPSIVGIYSIVFVYAVVSVPFVASGICICLILTRYTSHVSQLYAADLAGAALGCIILGVLLPLTDGPTAVIGVASIASVASLLLAMGSGSRRLTRLAQVSIVVFGAAFVGHTFLVWQQFPVLRILYAKGEFEARPLYETWNSYSRVRVWGKGDEPQPPFARSLSPTYPSDRRVRELRVDIDVAASTSMMNYTGDLSAVDFLKYDVTNVGHYVRPEGSTLVVGTGGGRDVLAALAFGASSVTGVEINRQILETVNGRFGDYSGHLDRDPRVRYVNDEARSYLARTGDRFDFLQISLIDTWAATAAGAFVLSENSVYTVEAWRIFLQRLTDGGLLSVSRWYEDARPAEVHRLVSLGVASLNAIGVQQVRDHLMLVRTRPTNGIGVGTLLVSRTPFTAQDLQRLYDTTDELEFEIMLSPRNAADQTLAQLTAGGDLRAVLDAYPVNITAPTDDSPFFFQMLRLRDVLRMQDLSPGKSGPNMQAVVVLGALLLAVVGLSIACVFVPLTMTTDRRHFSGAGPLVVFFCAIGLGFMMIETSMMQRLIIMLGHPTYSLSVVLFTVLLASGFGSHLTRNVTTEQLQQAGGVRLGALVGLLVLTGFATPYVADALEAARTPVRIAAAVALLAPAGVFMGMAFPLGMKLASVSAPALRPWLWGINGAFSVCASVLCIVVALATTISASFWLGCLSYVAALAAFVSAARRVDAKGQMSS